MTTIFKGLTNGGANRFFVKDEKILVAGADVAGRKEVNIDILEDVWGFDTKSTGSLNGPISANQINVVEIMKGPEDARVGTGDFRVVISGENVGGSFRFDFTEDFYKDVNLAKLNGTGRFEDDGSLVAASGIRVGGEQDGTVDSKTEGAAVNFALFLEQMLESDAISFIEDAGASVDIGNQEEGGDEIRNLEGALSQLNDNDVKDDFSVKFSGLGVGGSTSTDPFNTQGAAENFIDTVQLLGNGENGFLDEILV